MGSALAPEWCDRYVSLRIELVIPVLLTGTLGAYGPNNHLAGAGHSPYREAVADARAAGMPVFDDPVEAMAPLPSLRAHRHARAARRLARPEQLAAACAVDRNHEATRDAARRVCADSG